MQRSDAAIEREESDIQAHSAELRRDLGVVDLTLTQILFIVGLPWVGVAAKQGAAHVVFWLAAAALFYIPSAAIVIHLNRAMPLEGGLYQWAKIGFNELTGFLVAWNLWLFGILNTSETGLQVTQYFKYILGQRSDALTSSPWTIAFANVVVLAALAVVTIRGLSVGRWVHKAGGVLMLTTFGLLLALPWLNLARGTLTTFHPLETAMPAMTVMSFNLFGKMGFGAFGGFEYVAIHAGECRNPTRAIARSVVIAAPIIALMFILGTSSVLALVPIDQIDLIAPIPQVLSVGFAAFGYASTIALGTILMLLGIRIAQASVMFAGLTRLPMVAGWDGLLPAWFTRLDPRYRTPVNSIVFVAGATLVFSLLGLIGVGKQEAFQLLWNASAIFYALTYLVMFAVPLAGARALRGGGWLTIAAISGFLMTLLFVTLSILPIVDVGSQLLFAVKISAVVVGANAFGAMIFLRARRPGGSSRGRSRFDRSPGSRSSPRV